MHPEVERQEQTHLRTGRARWQAWAALESLMAKEWCWMVLLGVATGWV